MSDEKRVRCQECRSPVGLWARRCSACGAPAALGAFTARARGWDVRWLFQATRDVAAKLSSP